MNPQISTQLMTLSTLLVLVQGLAAPDRHPSSEKTSKLTYPIADTGQDRCFVARAEIAFPKQGEDWYGQDAQYRTRGPRYRDNGDGTISDLATGLTWQKADSGKAMDWKQSLAYASRLEVAGKSDWRLPDVKELQSLVDYDRAPDATDGSKRGAAIDPIFDFSETKSWFWSSTTHIENAGAYYVCFGQSFSARRQGGRQVNAHGAGAVRSDPKTGDPSRWPEGRGPQGDEVRIQNYVRCVRGGGATLLSKGPRHGAPRPAGGAEPLPEALRQEQGRQDLKRRVRRSRAEIR